MLAASRAERDVAEVRVATWWSSKAIVGRRGEVRAESSVVASREERPRADSMAARRESKDVMFVRVCSDEMLCCCWSFS